MRELLFLMPWAPIGRDRERLGLDTLAAAGFAVTAVDLSPLLAPEHAGGPAGDGTVRVESYEQFFELLSGKPGAVCCDYVLGRSPLGLKHARLFRTLAKAGTPYFSVLAAELPFSGPGRGGFWARAAARLCAARGLASYAVDLAARRPLAGLRRRGFFARPARIYALSRESAAGFAALCGAGAGAIRPVNSIDYGTFLLARQAGLKVQDGPSCVLIDEGIADSRDFAYAGLKGLTAAEYYPPVLAYLEKIERELGLKVVVAAHPKADPAGLGQAYGGREVVSGRTLETVAGASLVLAHWSTAVNFAVLCGKPLVLLKTRAMRGKGLARLADAMGAALGARVEEAEEALAAPLAYKPADLPRTGYASYLGRYIKSPEAPEETVYETIAADLAADWPAKGREVQGV